ncbi:MAG: glutamate racemase [Lactobacillaceae bacterium]|jgi:glutamate racemase|nr:glutamate racemase [Lactobacillaceae bacterium]
MDNRAIGYIDSGVGGLTVVKQALLQLPNEQIYYVGDTARMPYGPRPQAEVVEFTRQMAQFLLEKDIKLLVIACNTATAAALPILQDELEIPVIGVIRPGVDAALKATKNAEIGVIATAGTVKSMSYYNALLAGNQTANITQLAAPEFVDVVENYDYTSDYARQVVIDKLAYFNKHQVDTLILGCTHFPLLAPYIKEAMGPQVRLINSGAEAVDLVIKNIQEQQIEHDSQSVDHNQDRYYTTGDVERFEAIGERWLDNLKLNVTHLEINTTGLSVAL